MHQHNTRRIGSDKIRQLKLSIQIQECIWNGTKIPTDREAREGDLHVGADEVLLLAPEHVLEVGHDGGVHPREAVSSVHPHQELGPLPLRRDAHRDQKVPAENI